jgi:LysR family transcriptional regulator for bpeEF and oprC
MNELHALRVFCQVVEMKGFSQAAIKMGLSPASVTYSINQLEKQFQQPLFKRSTRRFSLTSAGERCYRSAQEILQQFDRLKNDMSSEFEQPRGPLRVEIASMLSSMHIAPALPAFLAQYPQLQLSVSVSDRLVYPTEDRADVFIRIGAGNIPDMVSRQLFLPRYLCCASPEYFARFGRPEHPEQLLEHQRLGFIRSGETAADDWQFIRDEQRYRLPPSPLLSFNHSHSLCEVAKNHLGLVYLLDCTLENYLQAGELEPVLQDWAPAGAPVNILYPRLRDQSHKIRVFVDFISRLFAGKPVGQ